MVHAAEKTFLSYAREDSEFAMRLANDLKREGANIWLDQLDILASQHWDNEVEKALIQCGRMVVVLTPDSVGSHNVMDEVSYALEEGKNVFPLLCRDCTIPFRLRRVQRVDFRTSYENGFLDLLRSLGINQTNSMGPSKLEDSHARDTIEPISLNRQADLVDHSAHPARTQIDDTTSVSEPKKLSQTVPGRAGSSEASGTRKGVLTKEAEIEQEEPRHQTASQKARYEKEKLHKASNQVHLQCTGSASDDQRDEAWEAERRKREAELTNALVEAWSSHRTKRGYLEETQLIKELRYSLKEWLSKRPQGFEDRQIKRRDQQEAETRKAIDLWLQRKEG